MSFEEDVLKDFITEAKENLERLDEEFVELEQRPEDKELLSSIFRTIHTIKGTAGFFGFKTLEAIAHFAEDILAKLRDGLVVADEETIDVLLKSVDYIKAIIAALEETGKEPIDDTYLEFLVDLRNFAEKVAKRAEGGGEDKKPSQEAKAEEASETSPEEKAKTEEQPKSEKTSEKEKTQPEEQPQKEAEAKVPAPKKEPEKKEKATPKTDKTPHVQLTETHVRVDVKLLDQLMNLAGELVLSRNRLVQIASRLSDSELQNATQNLSLVTTELQEKIMKTRMQPIGNVFNKFPRIVRDLARSTGKKVTLRIEGADTELDRSIIDAIKDPLTHLVRNSIDHGIEDPDIRVQVGKPPAGTLILRAYHEGGQVVIEIEDDGRGIDVEKVKQKAIEKGLISPSEAEKLSDREALALIFRPGFSTAEKVTNISGRGVGMDVVKTNVEKLGGSIDIQSVLGAGTTVRLKIPLTLAIIPALVVTCNSQRYAIPQVSLRELVGLSEETRKNIHQIGNSEFFRLRGEMVPIIRLSKILGVQPSEENHKEESLVILTSGAMDFGLVVDEIWDSEEIVVKPLGKHFKDLSIFAGATIMGDGKMALILDVVGISRKIGLKTEDVDRAKETIVSETFTEDDQQFILLFNVAPEEQFAIPLALVARLDKISADKLEFVGGKEIIQYRGRSMPIIRLENFLPIQPLPEQEEYHLLVFAEGENEVALLVSRIVDSIQTKIDLDEKLYQIEGVLGSAIIKDRTTLFLDVYKIIEMHDPYFFVKVVPQDDRPYRVLLAEDSPFFRQMIANYLASSGYEVETATDGLDAWEKLQKDSFDVLITDIEMPRMTGIELAKQVRSDERFANLPIIALTSLASDEDRRRGLEAGIDEYQVKLERSRVLESLAELLKRKKEEAQAA
ncbi:CheA signal transduction histidine kinase [Thermodesulfatator indicus DSM 15286]|uniref:histidine kinase n=1 Tax=Thermodesulfatator indicus (strain DSM 15286 / JCM 11887 / CIR29812) TaxID=667014 RepID=F8AA94_THEID|nr:chemotaxis protein CheW [Thermodesulfatator indicus]AEH44230.1 CheA signal transduction histidine kinase [Thermodesulfatator indicus DSM 15286]